MKEKIIDLKYGKLHLIKTKKFRSINIKVLLKDNVVKSDITKIIKFSRGMENKRFQKYTSPLLSSAQNCRVYDIKTYCNNNIRNSNIDNISVNSFNINIILYDKVSN